MADECDIANDLADSERSAALSKALSVAAAIPAGVAGTCVECGEDMPRLVGGRCGYCRDGR